METARQYPPARATQFIVAFAEKIALALVFILFFTSGFASLLYQVIWQRILAIFSGADVFSVTIIVAAFMGGLGIGSLAGGYLADRISPRMRIIMFACSELAIALFAIGSTRLYYDVLYQNFGYVARSPELLALVLFASLLWPTFFMGLSLPLLSKSLTRSVDGAAKTVGALYGCNTLGAAAGAFATAWFFIRLYGFETTIQFGAILDVFCAIGAILISPVFLMLSNRPVDEDPATQDAPEVDEKQVSPGSAFANPKPADPVYLRPTLYNGNSTYASDDYYHGIILEEEEEVIPVKPFIFPAPFWIIIYGLSGCIALSLEILWFRLLGIMLKSTAFTFGNLLAIYLVGLALGTFIGIGWASRSDRPAQIFLALQAGIPLYAGMTLNILSAALGRIGLLDPIWQYFGSYEPLDIGGAIAAIGRLASGLPLTPDQSGLNGDFLLLYFGVPLVIIGPPTLMMGMSFPFLQKVVQHNVASLGRRVGWLQTTNIIGSMIGSILTGWFLLKILGTPATLQVLLGIGGIFLFLYMYSEFAGYFNILKFGMTIAIVLVVFGLAVPNAPILWSRLHGTQSDRIIYSEDGAGLSILKGGNAEFSGITTVFANGVGQSQIPYGGDAGEHTMLGMLPAMIHADPKQIAVIGLGSGDTVFAAGGRQETANVTCIEIIGSQKTALEILNNRHTDGGLNSLLNDPRLKFVFTDGRAYITLGNTKYDIIEADALRPDSAYAGTLYSYEYFTLLKNHLNPGGLAVTWAPTPRVRDTFIKVFPYVLYFADGVDIMVGSSEPLNWNFDQFNNRLNSATTRIYYKNAGIDVDNYRTYFQKHTPTLYSPSFDRSKLTDLDTDLFPKDEFLSPR